MFLDFAVLGGALRRVVYCFGKGTAKTTDFPNADFPNANCRANEIRGEPHRLILDFALLNPGYLLHHPICRFR